MNVRIGIAAILEGLQGSRALQDLTPELEKLTRSDNVNVRADAAHYLGLTGAQQALPVLESLVNDPDNTVREIVIEGIDEIRNLQAKQK